MNKAGAWLEAVPAHAVASTTADQVVAVLTGAGVSLWRETLPALPSAKLQKILPGLMEDRLAGPASAMHFALMGTSADGSQLVAAVDRSVMDNAAATLAALGHAAARLVPDFMLLSESEGAQVLKGPDGLCRVRLPDGTGFTAEESLTESMLESASEVVVSPESWHATLARAAATPITLKQGRYAGRADMVTALLWFRRAGLIALAGLILWAVTVSFETTRLNREADAAYTEAEALFRASFPDVRRVANMRAQARQEVMKLRQLSGGEFLKLSTLLFEQSNTLEGVLLEGLRFDNARGELAATLSFASFADGETFKNGLSASGVMVTEGGSRQEGARVVTDLTLRSAS